ncbi:MAG TPA: FtsX-like permease family protein [Candidatus Acidoferrum sp.]|jgi:putative ABC transport system permease protein|nr:FtsX-like permease family protein [Candidatus Acidoferrum sp.]
MPRWKLFYRLMVRPLFREPVRLGLMVLAVGLGVAVVLAIELAGNAAAGSFHSSMESLAGDNDLEVVASGGVPEALVATLATQPYPLRLSPRMEDFAVDTRTRETLPLIGLDLIAEGSRYASQADAGYTDPNNKSMEGSVRDLESPESVWVSASLGKKTGEHISLLINDRVLDCLVRGVLPSTSGSENAILMDIAGAQRALNRFGRVDRILVKLPANSNLEEWQKKLSGVLPPGLEVRPQGTGTEENRKMLAAFRWNLRLLSYIALVVGAFLIYNTISVSVVRRRSEIGIVRALGANRKDVLAAFLGEAACLGLAGALVGLPLGRIMAGGAVKLMAATVESLYVSSRPGAIALTPYSLALALLIGVGVAVVSALSPAREAMQVSPVDAMAQGRREFIARARKGPDLAIAAVLAMLAALAARMPAFAGKPFFGYLATILLITAAAYAMPALVNFISGIAAGVLGKLFGVEAMLASRSLAASLRRTSVLVGALAVAVAMMVSVGIMVGSFRQTVVSWMNNQLPADLYLRPAGDAAADRHPTISVELVEKIAALPSVAAVQRLRAYEINYDGMPATLASVDLRVARAERKSDFFSRRPTGEVLEQLRGKNKIIVSEPFTYKHKVKSGDTITLSLGETRASFQIVDVYYDYASERGYILMDRDVLLKYLPDETPTNLAVFVAPDAQAAEVRKQIQEVAVGRRILIFSNRDLRTEAVRIFDRTFAITYALEGIAVIVAVMGIAGALMALVIDRRRELGLLRFLGASSGQIRKMILVEAGLLGLLANLAGFVLGYFLSLILVFVINKQSFGWTIRFHWPVAVLLGALTMVYAATVLSGLYPARVAVRLNPLEVIHEE